MKEAYDTLAAEEIQCQIHYVPVYWFPYYQQLGFEKGMCPNAESAYKGFLSIPIFPKMNNDDVENVVSAIKKVINYYR